MKKLKRTTTPPTDKEENPQEHLHFPQLPDACPDPMLITDAKGDIYYVNPAWEKLTGYKREEVLGKNPRLLSSGKTPKEIYQKLWKALASNKPFSSEEIIDRKKNGQEYSIRSMFFPIHRHGKNLFFVQVQYDITLRKKLEQKIHESEQKYRDLMEKSSEGIIVYDENGKVLEVNQMICKMLGYTKKELLSFHQYEFTDPDDLAKNPPHRQEILSGKTIRNERLLIKKDGSRIAVELTAKIQPNRTIEILYCDITQRKKLEQQKDTFIGIAAHELKTPITSIKAYTQLLNRKLQNTDRQDLKKLISQTDVQVSRLTELIEDLLNVNRIESGRLELHKSTQDINLLIADAVGSLQSAIVTHTISVKGKISKPLIFDELRIRQVLVNLLTNAVKYSPQANKVQVTVKEDENNIIIAVRDFGFGIDKEDQDKIFELFYRTHDKEVSNISGFGLGLFITSEIIKKHNGRLWVESVKGKGSTFYFSLPL